MQDRLTATVDFGTSRIALTVTEIRDEAAAVAYYVERPAEGIAHGIIFNIDKVAAVLKAEIEEAEAKLGTRISQAVVSLPRFDVRQSLVTKSIERSDAEASISSEELDSLDEMAESGYSADSGDIVYSVIPQSYNSGMLMQARRSEIEGAVGSVLEGNFNVITGSKTARSNIDKVMNVVGVAVAEYIFAPEYNGYCLLAPEERENGVALVEIGAGVTSVSIFHAGALRSYDAIPFGGGSITEDIKTEFVIPARLAENIKCKYGFCVPDNLANMADKVIRVERKDSAEIRQVSVKKLSQVIEARMSEIVDAVLYKIWHSGYADRLRLGIVLTGGGAYLTDIAQLVRNISGYKVRTGYPGKGIFDATDWPDMMRLSGVQSMAMTAVAVEMTQLDCKGEAIEQEPAADQGTDEDSYGGTVFEGGLEDEGKKDKGKQRWWKPKSEKRRKHSSNKLTGLVAAGISLFQDNFDDAMNPSDRSEDNAEEDEDQ